MTRDGGCLVIASSDKKVHVLRLSDQREATMQVGPDCSGKRGRVFFVGWNTDGRS